MFAWWWDVHDDEDSSGKYPASNCKYICVSQLNDILHVTMWYNNKTDKTHGKKVTYGNKLSYCKMVDCKK